MNVKINEHRWNWRYQLRHFQCDKIKMQNAYYARFINMYWVIPKRDVEFKGNHICTGGWGVGVGMPLYLSNDFHGETSENLSGTVMNIEKELNPDEKELNPDTRNRISSFIHQQICSSFCFLMKTKRNKQARNTFRWCTVNARYRH